MAATIEDSAGLVSIDLVAMSKAEMRAADESTHASSYSSQHVPEPAKNLPLGVGGVDAVDPKKLSDLNEIKFDSIDFMPPEDQPSASDQPGVEPIIDLDSVGVDEGTPVLDAGVNGVLPSAQPAGDPFPVEWCDSNLISPEAIKTLRAVVRGRDDVVAQRYKSGNRAGFHPICRNRFKKICNIKKGMIAPCKDCPNFKAVEMTDDLLFAHIAGGTLAGDGLGIYPLLPGGTCHFIAADFDNHDGKRNPLSDVCAYVETSKAQGVPAYVVRSKSGNGYHVYILFKEAVPAWKARLVAFALLKKAGGCDDQENISSFDRFFPNQDTLSGKKFGNLIALPWSWLPMRSGNTLFMDPSTGYQAPYQDQVNALRSFLRVGEEDLDRLISAWNLRREKAPVWGNGGEASYDQIKSGCAFMRNWEDNAATLSEPEWYAGLSIVARLKGGPEMAHEVSKAYPKYSQQETDEKITHALNDAGPVTCKRIQKDFKSDHCNDCANLNEIKSPINLGSKVVKQNAIDDRLAELNGKHFVTMIGGKCTVVNETKDPVGNRLDITFSSKNDFLNYYANDNYPNPKGDGEINAAVLWWTSPKRRQYEGILFAPGDNPPGYYNLYRGFAVSPQKGNWELYKNHIENVIANGNRARAAWILAWMARIVQDPGGERPGTSIVLRGKQGTGKGVFVNTFGSLFGGHFLQIAQASQVTGRFNSHLKDTLVGFVDEGFWAGDKQAEGALKNMVTEPTINIEAKGKDLVQFRNHINLLIASNSSWVIPAGLEERRFLVLDISDARQQDHPYFKAIIDQMNNGGREALLYDLLEMDISNIDLRTIERTDGLFDQILASMGTIQKFWFERLREGVISVQHFEWEGNIHTTLQYNEYIAFCETLKDRYPKSDQQFGRELSKICKGIRKERLRRDGNARKWVRFFPSLAECREQFEELVKMKIDWESGD